MRSRSKEIKIRMNDEEYEKYSSLLKNTSLSQNEYGIKKLLNQEIFVMPEAPELLRGLKGLGNNLNQIARNVNTGNTPPVELLEDLERQVEEVWQLLKRCGKVKA